MNCIASCTLSLLLLAFSATAQKPANASFSVKQKIQIEGDAGWDYLTVDTVFNRLFVSHGTVVNVVDLATYKVVKTIPNTNGVHGIALAYSFNKGFISCGKDNAVVIFNLQTLETTSTLPISGKNPDAILYDPFSKRVFTFNGRSSNATVINAETDKVEGTIELSGKPEFAVSDLKGKIYVNIEDKSTLIEIDPVKLQVIRSWTIAPGIEPSGLAIDLLSRKLFSVCDNKLMVVSDIASGNVQDTVIIGERVDGVAYDAGVSSIISSNGEGNCTIIQQNAQGKYIAVQKLMTQKGARTIAVNPKTHRFYTPTAEFGETPAATTENPRPRPSLKPGTFTVLEIGR